MKPKYKIGLVGLSLFLAACSGSKNEQHIETPSPVITTAYDGIWLSEPYGRGLKITKGVVEQFDYTSNYCLLAEQDNFNSEADLAEYLSLSSDTSELYFFGENGVSNFHAPTSAFTKASQLPAACLNGYEKLKGESGYSNNPVKNAEIFFETFKEYYLDFSLSQTDWDEVYQQAITQVHQDTTDAELFELFYQAISSLKDTHVSIQCANIGVASVNNKPVFWEVLLSEFASQNNLPLPLPSDKAQQANQYIDENLEKFKTITLSYAANQSSIHTYGNNALTWFKNEGIGYLAINQMLNITTDDDIESDIISAKTGITEALSDLSDTDALIIDVRLNNGGRDVVSMMYAKHLITNGGILASKQVSDMMGNSYTMNYELQPAANTYQKPIFILTSASTVSAAEAFVLMMKSQPNVTIVGERTQGALSDVLHKKLPNGFEFNLSNEKYLSVDGEWFEKVGIPVDVEVPFMTLESRLQQEDAGIETVLALLN